MPLRDHFRPPVWNQASWEGFHGGWPMMMVLRPRTQITEGLCGRAARSSGHLLRDRRMHVRQGWQEGLAL